MEVHHCQSRRATPLMHLDGHAVKILVRTAKVTLTAKQRSQVELQLGLALGRFANRIHRVVGHLRDESVGRSHEVRCRVDVDLRPLKISVEDGDVSPVLAARRAALLVSRSVARALERERRPHHALGHGVPVSPARPTRPTRDTRVKTTRRSGTGLRPTRPAKA
jgi:hypothetical protein